MLFRSHKVFFSLFHYFSFFETIHVLQLACPIFHVFQCFLPYSRSYNVQFSFSTFFSVSRHIPVLQYVFLIFPDSHIPGPEVCFSFFPCFSVFLPYPDPKVCVSHFLLFQFSCHITGPTLCVYHFPCFSVFLAIIQVI